MSPRLFIFRLLLCNLVLVPSVHGLRTSHDTVRRKHLTSTIVRSILNLTKKANCSQNEFAAARSIISNPPASQVVSQPYATSLPVIYITAGGERENSFKKLYANFTPRLYRVKAVDGKNLSQVGSMITNASKTIALFQENKVSSRAIGCMLSHMAALRKAFTLGMEAALILEDDAVPLVPWWPVSLEEFVLRLPQQWHASQLQWSTNYNKSSFSQALAQKKGNHSRLFAAGTGWGTAAYLISRRGMKKVAHDLWDYATRRFDTLRLIRNCRKFSADDCLLGFTDTASKKTRREVKRTASIRNIFRANPPYFIHGSTRRKVHRFNLCVDTVAVATSPKQAPPLTQTNDPQRKKLLLFVPASMNAAKAQIFTNIKHARESAGSNCCDLYPAFRGRDIRQKTKNLIVPQLDKFELLRQHYENFGKAWERSYDYIWVLDTNMDLTAEDIQKVISAVESVRPVVAQPVVSQLVANRSDVVDVAAPLIRTNALSRVLWRFGKKTGHTGLNCTSTPSPAPDASVPLTILQPEHVNDDALAEGSTSPDSSTGQQTRLSCINLEARINLQAGLKI